MSKLKIYTALVLMLSVVMMSFSPMVASAAPLNDNRTFTFDYDINRTVTISGTVGSEYANRYATLIILNPGKRITNISTEEDVINWADQTKVEDDGTYTFTVKLETVDYGTRYSSMVTVDGLGTTRNKYFNFYNETDINAIRDKIKSGVASDIADVLANHDDVLNIELDAYEALPSENKDLANEGIASMRLTTFAAFEKAVVETVAVQQLNQISDLATFKTSFNDNFQDKAQDVVNEEFDTWTDESADALYTTMMNTNYKNLDELITAYSQGVILRSFNNRTLQKAGMAALLEKFAPALELDLTEYNTLSYPVNAANRVILAQADADYATFGEIKTAFDAAVTAQKTEENANISIGGSNRPSQNGSSGGSSGGGISISGPSVVTPIIVDPFSDLGTVAWAKESIATLKSKGVISGDGTGFYRPNDNTSRAEFVKMAVMAFSLTKGDAVINFADVKSTDWYYDVINIAYSKGIINGVSETSFNPEGTILRQDIAKILYNILLENGVTFDKTELGFKDASSIDSYAREAVAALCSKGIISGYGDNTFAPKAYATRAETAKLLCGAMKLLAE